MRRLLYSVVLGVVALVAIQGCADPIPEDYVPQLVVEGFVIAGQPITHLRVYQSQPISDTFKLATASIRDAQVTLLENGTPIPMVFVDDSTGGNYLPADTSFRVKYESTYELSVTAIGKHATATARTKAPFVWERKPTDSLWYPGEDNELKPVDSLGISWQGQPGITQYVIAVECLDTTNYGSYLIPATTDTNGRIRKKDFQDGTLVASERTRYGFSLAANTPVVWAAFKWFGTHRIIVYAGDDAFQNWFRSVGLGRRAEYDYRLSNVHGGLGTFAGASAIEAPIFLFKKP